MTVVCSSAIAQTTHASMNGNDTGAWRTVSQCECVCDANRKLQCVGLEDVQICTMHFFSTAIYRHCLRLSGLSLPIFLPNSLPISLTMFSNDVPNARFCLIFLSISTGLRTHIDCTRTRQMLCCAHSAPLPH